MKNSPDTYPRKSRETLKRSLLAAIWSSALLIALLLVTISGGADSLWSAHGGEMPMWVKTVTHIAMAWVLVAYVFVVKCLIKSYRQAEGQVGS